LRRDSTRASHASSLRTAARQTSGSPRRTARSARSRISPRASAQRPSRARSCSPSGC
jgi:hypothetical protein